MSSQSLGKSPIIKVYNLSRQFIKEKPALFIPFIIFFIFESLALILLFLAPRTPLRFIFGPPIRTFWSERFLHYPSNFLLLPKLASLSKMGLSIILGSLLTGMAVAIIYDVYNNKEIKLKASFKTALNKYVYLFTVVFIFTTLFYVSIKIITIASIRYFMAGHSRILFFSTKAWMGPVFIIINFIIALLIQSAFIYAIPILIIEKANLIKSITQSFTLFKKQFIPTIIFVGLPMFLFIPILISQYNSAFLINRLFPEVVLYVSFLGIIITSLVIDPLIVISTTIFYLINKGK